MTQKKFVINLSHPKKVFFKVPKSPGNMVRDRRNIMKKFAATLTNAEVAFARKVEAAGLASYSQAVKAIERQDEVKLAAWRKALAAK